MTGRWSLKCSNTIPSKWPSRLAPGILQLTPYITYIIIYSHATNFFFFQFNLKCVGVCSDLRYCLAFCNGENYLRSWNLASKINDQSLTATANKGKKTNGIQEIVTMQNYPRQVQIRQFFDLKHCLLF